MTTATPALSPALYPTVPPSRREAKAVAAFEAAAREHGEAQARLRNLQAVVATGGDRS